ncbi:MAG: ATP-binding protein [Opitutus sp.]|nr:ATP-binding protein [Opitutus sp.]MCS6247268.1 ATP-binding protein [Opitutus sp.]MCS6273325.1 ATP-binding protein [Opitutus sp.]MCS6278124.1 ATP-binding protein [Opitutus sp.]MCS6299234.1 ATP-binding protein [Opitutus sp.]
MTKTNTLELVRGPLQSAQRITFYAPSGLGKSSCFKDTTDTIYLDAEGGTEHLNVTRFPRPKCWQDVEAAIDFLDAGQHTFRFLVIDTADWIEKLLVEDICQKSHKTSIEDFGYGKGWIAVTERWSAFLARLDRLRATGLNIVFLAHSTVKKFEQPDAAGSYDRFELKLSKGCSALLKEWSDAVLFGNFHTKVVEATDGKKRAIGGRERIIHTTHSAAYDAKNRHGLPESMPLCWASFVPIFGAFAKPGIHPSPVPAPIPARAAPSSPASPTAQTTRTAAPVILITREQVEKLTLYWATLNKTHEDRAKAFAWVGCDSIDLHWNELTAEQADRLIGKLQDQMNKIAEGSTSTAAKAASRQNGGAR